VLATTPLALPQYITDNNLPNKSSDTSTTGDIYDYVVEGLSATVDFVNCGVVVLVVGNTIAVIIIITDTFCNQFKLLTPPPHKPLLLP
jgi:hypothetical protein